MIHSLAILQLCIISFIWQKAQKCIFPSILAVLRNSSAGEALSSKQWLLSFWLLFRLSLLSQCNIEQQLEKFQMSSL